MAKNVEKADRRQIEHVVLRTFLSDKKTLSKNIARVSNDMFYASSRALIFSVIKEYYLKHKTLISRRALKLSIKKMAARDFFDPPQKGNVEKIVAYRKRVSDSRKLAIIELDEIYKIEPSIAKGYRDSFDLWFDKWVNDIKGANVVDSAVQALELVVNENDVQEAVRTLKKLIFSGSDEFRKLNPIGDVFDIEELRTILRRRRDNPNIGMKTGIDAFDGATGGIFEKEVCVIYALSSEGKSTFTRNLVLGIVANNPFNVLHISNEEDYEQVKCKYSAILDDLSYYPFKIGRVGSKEVNKIEKISSQLKARIKCREIDALESAEVIRETLEELREDGVEIDVLVVDWIDQMVPLKARGYSQWDDEAMVMGDIKNLTKEYGIRTVALCQAGTEAFGVKKVDNANMFHVSGSKKKAQLSNLMIFLKVLQEDKAVAISSGETLTTAMLMKNRDSPTGYWKMQIDGATGRMWQQGDFIQRSFRA